MRIRNYLLIAGTALMTVACSAKAEEPTYTLTVSADGLNDGDIVYLMNYDTSEKVDSAVVNGGKAVISGTVATPFAARTFFGGKRGGTLIIEAGEIVQNNGEATGTDLNAKLNEYGNKMAEMQQAYMAAADDATRDSIFIAADALTNNTIKENAENPIGYLMFVDKAYSMSADELKAALEEYPMMKDFVRVQDIQNVFARKEATAPGKMFTDFSIEYDGQTYKLSDDVGKGNFVLVDFWASWCGPCRRESKVIKEIYKEYAPKGLEVVGIAVWDEPENTLAAIEQLQLPWKQVLNGQKIPTDLYGILGIPCIILFGPDGTIVARDVQGDDLRAAVAAAFAEAAE